jgi:hypothetical protein
MLLAQGTQGVGQGRTDGPAIHATLRGRRELGRKRTAAGDPRLTPSEQPGYGREAEAVVFVERSDHPRFVHGSGRARRRVRSQQEPFDLRRRAGALDHGRDRRLSAVAAVSQALEAVDDFERAILLRHDPDRQLGQLRRVRQRRGTAEPGEARAQERDRNLSDRQRRWRRRRLRWAGQHRHVHDTPR